MKKTEYCANCGQRDKDLTPFYTDPLTTFDVTEANYYCPWCYEEVYQKVRGLRAGGLTPEQQAWWTP